MSDLRKAGKAEEIESEFPGLHLPITETSLS